MSYRIITVLPDDECYTWQVITFLESCRIYKYSANTQVLLFKPEDRAEWNKSWENIEKMFPEVEFFRYEDKGIINLIEVYPSVIRPFVMREHFIKFPELKNETIVYLDCDIIFVRYIDWDSFSKDRVWVTDARSYTNADYFNRKESQAIPHTRDGYPDVLANCAKIVGITKDIIEENNDNSGGAQYIFNGINADFWEEVFNCCIYIYIYLGDVNKNFFKSEDEGIQRWCTDMFVTLWLLWKRGIKTEISPLLDMALATDRIEKLDEVSIIHNAGITSESSIKDRRNKEEISCPAFYKGKYVSGGSPYDDEEYISNILNNSTSSKYCSHYYLKSVVMAGLKHNLINVNF